MIKCKCLSYQKLFKQNKDLKKRFKNAFKFFNNHINKLILLLRKDVTPYEYMDDWEKFNATTLPAKGIFYSNVNMEDVTEADYMHAKIVLNNPKEKIIMNMIICILEVRYYF